jgi:hypothetical protein
MLTFARAFRCAPARYSCTQCQRQQTRALHKSSEISTFRSLISRLGYITNNGVSLKTAPSTAEILKRLCSEWRDLIAGTEGYLTAQDRRGISGRAVEWGDMVSFGDNRGFFF